MELLRLEGIDPEHRAVVSREELRIVLEALAVRFDMAKQASEALPRRQAGESGPAARPGLALAGPGRLLAGERASCSPGSFPLAPHPSGDRAL